jgi:hypothetical protein
MLEDEKTSYVHGAAKSIFKKMAMLPKAIYKFNMIPIKF